MSSVSISACLRIRREPRFGLLDELPGECCHFGPVCAEDRLGAVPEDEPRELVPVPVELGGTEQPPHSEGVAVIMVVPASRIGDVLGGGASGDDAAVTYRIGPR